MLYALSEVDVEQLLFDSADAVRLVDPPLSPRGATGDEDLDRDGVGVVQIRLRQGRGDFYRGT